MQTLTKFGPSCERQEASVAQPAKVPKTTEGDYVGFFQAVPE